MPTTISAEKFVTDLLNTVDLVIQTFVQNGFNAFVTNNQTTLTLVMTFYLMWMGYRFATRTLEMDIVVVAKHISLLSMVYGLITNWDLFWLFFYNVFTNEPAAITKTMLSANSDHINFGVNTTADALNNVFSQGMQATGLLLQYANWHNSNLYLYAALTFMATCVSCLFALMLFVYAKMAMAIILFLAPLFMSFLLWESTRKLFDSWLQAAINYALIPIVTCGILMLTLTLAQITLPNMVQEAQQGMAHFTGILPFIGVSLISFLILKQVFSICAALSTGMALEGISSAIPVAKNLSKYAGTTLAAKSAATLGAKGYGTIKDKLRAGKANAK